MPPSPKPYHNTVFVIRIVRKRWAYAVRGCGWYIILFGVVILPCLVLSCFVLSCVLCVVSVCVVVCCVTSGVSCACFWMRVYWRYSQFPPTLSFSPFGVLPFQSFSPGTTFVTLPQRIIIIYYVFLIWHAGVTLSLPNFGNEIMINNHWICHIVASFPCSAVGSVELLFLRWIAETLTDLISFAVLH